MKIIGMRRRAEQYVSLFLRKRKALPVRLEYVSTCSLYELRTLFGESGLDNFSSCPFTHVVLDLLKILCLFGQRGGTLAECEGGHGLILNDVFAFKKQSFLLHVFEFGVLTIIQCYY